MRLAAWLLLPLVAVSLSACGDPIQGKPVAHNVLEGLVAAPHVVYWLGGSFSGMELSEAVHDPSGAYSVQYGPCVKGGQGTCTPALRIVSSPDNTFLPGGATPAHAITVRGRRAVALQGGRTLVIPTAGVVVDVYASTRALAAAAARTMVPINHVLAPGDPLPAPLPPTPFGARPLPSQLPSPLTSALATR